MKKKPNPNYSSFFSPLRVRTFKVFSVQTCDIGVYGTW